MIKIGDEAPAFSMVDSAGNTVNNDSLKGKRAVFFFYPKDLTPGWTKEVCAFRDINAKFGEKNTVIYGVSKDNTATHNKFIDQHELNFPLLTDTDGSACKAFGAWGEKSFMGKLLMGIFRYTYVIDADGKIEAIYEKVKPEEHAQEVFDNLKWFFV